MGKRDAEMVSKLVSLQEAASLVEDGQMIALGGKSLSRTPSSFARELVRQGRRGLRLIKTVGAYDIDLLCAARATSEVQSGCMDYENVFGMAPSYRHGVESGAVRVVEHVCDSIIAGLRASSYGLPSQPINVLQGPDTPALSDFRETEDPYTGKKVLMIPRIRPDWGVVHVQHADVEGNARIDGGPFEDVLISRASEGLIITAERIVETAFFKNKPERTNIPAFMTRAVVHAPGGAAPASCYPTYDMDVDAIATFLESAKSPETLQGHLDEWRERDYSGAREREAK
ncbi:MAG: CoA transferase subunit A [Nitrospinaceae bacterium]|jgi:glutaconate CoA-transferase, subunit A|nr:CoA transferase subunit A [Nitrospinaceae bacterium]MBT4094345.1 CoA transferase subunit A [Nitrospinaceae bacterium]MBT4431032.1 CoA transferase subunit A [Nitrospinaceae bacterium]MBT5366440.1 CoA transferase subunit A [Nitrospinaceae bacterium]MBT5948159.1 CoA transferase subunit A [Nitrospinaceae bacterium]